VIGGVDFDHLAVAAATRSDLERRYAGDLGATYVTSGQTAGLYATIVRFANGVKLEAIEPYEVDQDDFLARFLVRHGPGFHHITFVVPDVDAAAAATEAQGYRLLGSRTTHLTEVFLHPKQALGVVVQYIERRNYQGAAPSGFPLGPPAADLDHLTLVVPSLDAARAVFVDLLGGRESPPGAGEQARWVDLSWPAPGRIRLLEPAAGSPLRSWLGDRPGAVHHLALSLDDPAAVPDAVPVGEGAWEVEPQDNFGVRLRLRARRPPRPGPASARPGF
jgi:catechol 2,3-dioxygenase-like lactoylglutathione lyase family enzyme